MKALAQQIAKNISAGSSARNEKVMNKTSYRIALNEERRQKLKKRDSLKKLNPMELQLLNCKTLEQRDVSNNTNKVDDEDASIDFSSALDIADKSTVLYRNLNKNNSMKIIKNAVSVASTSVSEKYNEDGVKKEQREAFSNRMNVNRSRKIDGEVVEGLVRIEVKKQNSKFPQKHRSQDDYVLNKLFNKKGKVNNRYAL